MIPASDLRIGNWVYVTNWDYFKVLQILEDGVIIFNGHGEEPFMNLEPIPLTPDILEKCGFEELDGNEYYRFFDLDAVRVYIHRMDNSAFVSYSQSTLDHYTNNLHLHQLQNIIYALTNNELTINLDQVK